MGIYTSRPDETVNGWGALVTHGVGTAWGCCSDNNDGTWVESGTSAGLVLGYADPGVPAGYRVKEVRFRARVLGIGSLRFISALGHSFPDYYFSSFLPTTVELGRASISSVPADIEARDDLYAGGSSVDLIETYLDFVAVSPPVATPDGPTGTIATNRPTVTWDNVREDIGGGVKKFHAKIFTEAETLAGGFNPESSVSGSDSGESVGGSLTKLPGGSTEPRQWRSSAVLPDGDYVVFVKVAQSINGADFWGPWGDIAFTIDAPEPNSPNISLIPESDDGRMRMGITADNGGVVDTTQIEIQRSVDGVNWEALRTVAGSGIIAPGEVAWDFEGGNGQLIYYRARAIHIALSGDITYSTWATDSSMWSSDDYWLKHPNIPTLNVRANDLTSYPGKTTMARKGEHVVLGKKRPIVTSDIRGGASGTIKIAAAEDIDRERIDAILAGNAALLLQLRPTDHEPDRWMSFGDQTRERYVDHASFGRTQDELPWTEVDRPAGNIAAWPPELYPSGSLYPSESLYPDDEES